MKRDIVIIRGGGDIATGIAHKLHRSGFKVLVLEIEQPLVIRRKVAFAQAIFDGETVVEDVKAIKADKVEDIYKIWNKKCIPVYVDENCEILREIKGNILIDSTLSKKNTGMNKDLAPITIGVGPGFEASKDVDIVIETNRGHDLGKLIFNGYAEADTGIPGSILGFTKERIIRAPIGGVINLVADIGKLVNEGETVAMIESTRVKAPITGVLRGMIMDGRLVKEGLKIGDVDPRSIIEYCYTISDKARTIAGGVLEAILYMKNQLV